VLSSCKSIQNEKAGDKGEEQSVDFDDSISLYVFCEEFPVRPFALNKKYGA